MRQHYYILACLVGMFCFEESLASSDTESRADGRLGMEAYAQGHYELSLAFLSAALTKDTQSTELRTEWLHTVAHILWETGQDIELLDFSERELNKAAQEKWWCHVLERRGHLDEAVMCWYQIGDTRRAERAIRSVEIQDIFGELGSHTGYARGQ